MLVDAGPFQIWITAHDNYERAEQRLAAAAKQNHRPLIEYLATQRDDALKAYQAAIRSLNA